MKQLKLRGSLAAAICLTVAAGCLLLPQAKAFFAHNFPCDWHVAFVPDPVKKTRVGYITDFQGLGFTAAKDLAVHLPAGATHSYAPLAVTGGVAHVAAVIESISWNGGVGDAITISCYMSQENAIHLKNLKQATLKTTSISSLGFWVADYDQETKAWFEEFHPMTSSGKFMGQVNVPSKTDIRLHIGDEGLKVSPGSTESVYNVYFEVIPAANQTATFNVATSPTKKVAKNWGMMVGALPGHAGPSHE